MTASKENICILILAAGASSRMGRPKQLLSWKGTTLLENAIRNAKLSKAQAVHIVLGANAERIREEIELDFIEVIENPNWESGLGSSIAAGMTFLSEQNKAFDGVLVMLADQPLIDTDYLNLLIASFYKRPKNIIATTYKNRAGVPALFHKVYFGELLNLREDFGAKALISANENQVFTLNPENKAVDIDTEAEYNLLISKIK